MTEQTAQTLLLYLQSEEHAQSILRERYTKLNIADPIGKSYTNSQTFIYELNHGLELLNQGKRLPYSMQPILYYYGLVHLLKASLRLIRPEYPEKSSQLAHGISARKIKRQDYTFFKDEVNIQLQGLFPYCAEHLFGIEQFSKRKLQMGSLLRLIPEVSPLFDLRREPSLLKVGNSQNIKISFPNDILDSHHISQAQFIRDIEQVTNARVLQDDEKMTFQLTKSIDSTMLPFRLSQAGDIYFPSSKGDAHMMPDLLINYMILYNLSMLARYDTEWWAELFVLKQDFDYPLIIQLLQASVQNIPIQIAQFIKNHIEK